MTGDELREIRGRLGMTQRQLGSWIGRTHATMSLYEKGHYPIPDDIADKVRGMLTEKSAIAS